jgi:DNA repair protein SbcD/Mre11
VLLGRGGRWQEHRLAAHPGVRLLGWSFATQRVRENPLTSLQWHAEPDIATLGVLHCDVGVSGSDYAPVRRRELEQVPVDAWLLGHIHKPDDLRGERPIGYLGSVVGLDPGEPGAHGPWLVEVEAPGRVRAQQIPLAPLRWEPIELLLSELDSGADEGRADAAEEGADDAAEDGANDAAEEGATDAAEDGLEDALHAALRRRVAVLHDEIAAGLAGSASGPRLVGCRLTLRGRGRHHRALRRLLATLHFELPIAGVLYFIEKVQDEGAPDLDLAALAAGSDPLALLARRLQQLAAGDGQDAALLREARARLAVRCSETRFSNPGVDLRDDEALRDLLRRAGTQQLEELLAQRERPAAERAGDAA